MNRSRSLASASSPALVCGLALAGCGGPGVDGDAGSVIANDAGSSSTHDAWSLDDAWSSVDAPIASLDGGAAILSEVCTGGLDEDADGRTDCDDDACWSEDACIAADVARVATGLAPCGDPIAIDAATSRSTCEMLMPQGREQPRECDVGPSSAEAQLFCDAEGAPAALWIDEHLETPRSSRMLSERFFESTSFERTSILEWERQDSGASARESNGPISSHEWQDRISSEHTTFRVITVRPVIAGDVIARLLGMSRIVSTIDVDAGRSTDTRAPLLAGGIRIVVPRP